MSHHCSPTTSLLSGRRAAQAAAEALRLLSGQPPPFHSTTPPDTGRAFLESPVSELSMGTGTECRASRGWGLRRQGRRGAKEAAGSQSPGRVPCVQRQKMVSERPGLLLVPHTSSTSSLVSSDMMGCRRAGLRFQDSRPGTWGRGAFRDGRCGTAAAQELGGWTGGPRTDSSLLAETAPVTPAGAAARSSPCRKCRHFRLPLRYRPPPRRAGESLPGSGSGGGRKSLGTLWWPPAFPSSAPLP